MPVKYQVITANDTEDLAIRCRAMEAQGYLAVGSIICGTREETINHVIKGEIIKHHTYLSQSFWYAPNADSAFADCIKQHELLTAVVDNANAPFQEYPEHVEIDRDIIEVIEEHLRGDAV